MGARVGDRLRAATGGYLEHAARLYDPAGGSSTPRAPFAPEEDEETVARFLGSHPDFEIVEPVRRPGFS